MDILLASPQLDVFEQMALDETLVRVRPQAVTLRFYRWTPGPAVTFGYAQFISEVRRTLAQGGGIVFHEDDLTFSLVFEAPGRPADIYKNFHAHIHAQLNRLGEKGEIFDKTLPASAYAPSVNHTASACFSNPVENDLLAENGHKILGGALRRFGTTVLYQGSLQLPQARENPAYKNAIIAAVRAYLAADLHPHRATEEWVLQAKELARAQYHTQAWTEKF